MLYRINGLDGAMPRFLTVPHEADAPAGAVEWAQRHTVFKPYSTRQLMACLQVWDGRQWKWVEQKNN